MRGIARQFPRQRVRGRAGEFRRRCFHHGQDGSLPVERFLELIVALAPVQIGLDQRIDVGVDDEVPGRVVSRRYRKGERDQDSGEGKSRGGFDNRYNNTCQHIFSF